MKKGNKTSIFKNAVCLILIAILIYSGTKIFNWSKENVQNKSIAENINKAAVAKTNDEENKYTVDFNMLKKQNSDTVAWIKVNGTNIKYPIVKAKDNEYYLTHSFDKSSNSAGWIFADYKNKFDGTDKNIVVFGHNRKDKSMFGSLKNILTSKWQNNSENTEITFVSENENCLYKVFSIYQIEKEDYYIKTNFSNNNEFEKFLETIKNRSVKNFGTPVSSVDRILTLSTCASNDNYRIVLHAKKSN